MPRNDIAAPAHVCPGISIHAIDMVQPPGIGISPIADMDALQTIVTAALAAKSSAERPKKVRRESCSEAMRCELPIPLRRPSATNSVGSAATAADLSEPMPPRLAGTPRKPKTPADNSNVNLRLDH